MSEDSITLSRLSDAIHPREMHHRAPRSSLMYSIRQKRLSGRCRAHCRQRFFQMTRIETLLFA